VTAKVSKPAKAPAVKKASQDAKPKKPAAKTIAKATSKKKK